MKKQLRKISLAVIFALAVSMLMPATQVVEAAAKKTFTYSEQKSGSKVTTLFMDRGEKVDLKFDGVSNWRSYTYKWSSSDPKVAVVDGAGVITAIGNGVTTIKLMVGDGSEYTSVGVTVYVGPNYKQNVCIGTAAETEIKSHTMGMGSSVILKANGLKDNVGDRYTATWTSTNPSVAKIDSNGVVTPVAPGLTVIQLTVKKNFSGEVMVADPIALLVTGAGSSVPATATPVPSVTTKPTVTVKPSATPTAAPTLTPIATPVPSDKYVPYTAVLEADNCLLLKFTNAVDYKTSDVSLYQLITAGNQVVEVKWEIMSATLSNGGTELRIVPIIPFNNGEKYIVKAGSADPGKNVNIVIGDPNRLEVSYKCLGEENVAYAYDEDVALDVPVELSYRLYYGNIDVTESYKNRGYITYDFASSKYEENVSLDGDVVNFFAPRVSAVITAVYTYYNDNDVEKQIKDTVPMTSKALPPYGVQRRVVNWTIINTEDDAKIDWNNPVQQVVSGEEDAKVVAIIADTYGYYYATDKLGEDIANNIYYINDEDSLISRFGYSVEFSAADTDQFIMNEDGTMYPYQSVSRATILVNLVDSGLNGGNYSTTTIGFCQMKILAESKLSSITAEETRVTLALEAEDGYEERFCEADVEILLKDQYGNEMKNADYEFELTSSNTKVNKALDSYNPPAEMNGTTLHIDAQSIKEALGTTAGSTSVSFTIKETTINKRVTVSVSLQSPKKNSNGTFNITGWDVELDKDTVNLGDVDLTTLVQDVTIEAFRTTSNNVKVGLYSDLHLLKSIDHDFTLTNCREGEVYVLVLGPDGDPVEIGDSNSLGVYIDEEDDCVRVNVSAPINNSSNLESLKAGKYIVKVTRITGMGTKVPKTVTTPLYFTVVDNTKDVKYRSVRSTSTDLTVDGENDLAGVSEIIEQLFIFELGGKEWTDMDASMIKAVDYTKNGKYIRIRDIDFAVPIEGNDKITITYTKNVIVNKTIETGSAD